ncbi:glycosyltransferase [Pedobacter sp. PWIIR3]
MKNWPKVSLCIPTYNSEAYLEETLTSIKNQTYTNIEVIIVDNCSTDGTVGIIKEFAEKYNWKYVLNDENIGAGLNMNKSISFANGELVAVYHSDDIYDPEIVSKSVAFLELNADCGFVSTLAKLINAVGDEQGQLKLPGSLKSKNRNIYNFEEIFSAILDSFVPFLITPTVMVRKSIYDKLGHFKIHGKYKSAGDYEMWLRILKNYPAGIIPEPLIKYRKHAQQGSQKEIRENYGLPDGLVVYEEYSQGDRLLEEKYRRVFSYLLMLQVLKLNSRGDFQNSKNMIRLIKERGNFQYKFAGVLFNLLNFFKIRFNVELLDGVKSFLAKNN